MELKYKIILIIIVLVLIAFLFPKPCSNSGTAVSPLAKYKDCNCIGAKINILPFFQGASSTPCFGIPTSYSCYYNRLPEPPEKGVQRVYIPCE